MSDPIDGERKSCVSVGRAGCVSVNIQARVACLSTSTHAADADREGHVSTMTFISIDEADELSRLLATVRAMHAEHFGPVRA